MQAHLALKKYYDRRRQASPGFSLRALARRLKVSPSFMSRVLNGKRPLPDSLLSGLARELNVEPELLSGAASAPKARRPKEVSDAIEDWNISSTESLQILRTWYFVPILEATTLTDFDGSSAQISARLGLPAHLTEMALGELVSLGLVRKDGDRFAKTDKKLRMTSSRPHPLIRKFHDDMMTKAQAQLRKPTSEEDLARRLITGITISANPQKVQEAKRKLAECLHEIANDLTAEAGTEVYQLAAQLFPLTQRRPKE